MPLSCESDSSRLPTAALRPPWASAKRLIVRSFYLRQRRANRSLCEPQRRSPPPRSSRLGAPRLCGFAVELTFAGVFRVQNVPAETLRPLVMIECPRLLFPFAREIAANAVRDGGYRQAAQPAVRSISPRGAVPLAA
jgi:hypothetical protein